MTTSYPDHLSCLSVCRMKLAEWQFSVGHFMAQNLNGVLDLAINNNVWDFFNENWLGPYYELTNYGSLKWLFLK
jgi:hypothetical protein